MIIFGDSHIALYDGVPDIRAVHLGPVTMHRLGRDGLASAGVNAALVRPNETIGLVCGEIDVRVCFARQRDTLHREPIEIVAGLVERYFGAIELFMASLRDRQRLVIFSVTPPAATAYPSFDPAFPRNGTDADRVEWTRLLNSALEEATAAKGYLFVDQHSMFADTDGLLDRAFSSDAVHLDQRHVGLVDLSMCRKSLAASSVTGPHGF